MTDQQDEGAGYVYVLINAAFPEFIKIGMTTLDPKERAKQLSAGTGIPAPYAVAWKVHISDCMAVEQLAHAKLAAHRTRNNREFFRLPVEDAIQVISVIAAPYRSPAGAMGTETAPAEAASFVESPKPAPAPHSAAVTGESSVEGEKYLSVEAHSADAMAPNLKPHKLAALRALRAAVLKVAPDCLWRMRGDGKITFTPLPHRDRAWRKNLMTVHLRESPVGYRIGNEVRKFSADNLAEIEVKLKALLDQRG